MTPDSRLPAPSSRLIETEIGKTPVSKRALPEDLLREARRSDRPDDARDLCDRLSQCDVASSWTREDAMRWWETRLEPEPALNFAD